MPDEGQNKGQAYFHVKKCQICMRPEVFICNLRHFSAWQPQLNGNQSHYVLCRGLIVTFNGKPEPNGWLLSCRDAEDCMSSGFCLIYDVNQSNYRKQQ